MRWRQIWAAYFACAKPGLDVTARDRLNVVDIQAFPTGVPLPIFETLAAWRAVINTSPLRDVHPSGEIRLC